MFLFADGLVAEIKKKATEAFEVFDRESNQTVDVREIGCIIRSLGCFPSEAEIQELIEKMEVEEAGGFVHLEKFLPVVTKVLLDRRTYTGKREGIRCIVLFLFYSVRIKRRSFQGKSSQSLKGQNIILCCLSGEPFNQEEMEDMLAIALDPESDTFHYRDYRKKLVVDETKTFPFNV
uniref:EF-hand domain-containing protein n=1 Tax=Zosterops lateralis melanops TaxID=1220523 RepID=A0A8D2QUA4_ZOSLA